MDTTLGRGFLSLLALLIVLVGCNQSAPPPLPPTTSVAHQRPQPEAVLEQMIRAYATAHSYQDRGELQLVYTMDGRVQRDTATFSVSLERPNRLRMLAYQVDMVCRDGRLQAKVADPTTGHLDSQVVVRPTGESLTLSEVLADSLIEELLGQGLGRLPVQLELLLGQQPLATFLGSDVRRRLLDDRVLNDARCYRVEVQTAEGPFVLWIDQQNSLLLRMEYPTRDVADRLGADTNIEQIELIAEFRNARFDIADRSALQAWEIPAESKRVRHFVRPPRPLPVNGFGQTVEPFVLDRLDGQALASAELAGRITVLHWYVDHPACRSSMELFDKVRAKYAGHGELQFYAVSAEHSGVSTDELRDRLAQWSLSTPILRDLNAAGRDVFNIEVLPAVVVLGKEGTLQLFDSRFNPDLEVQLTEAIERLLQGEDLGVTVLAQAQNDAVEYARLLTAASATGDDMANVERQFVADNSSNGSANTLPVSRPERLTLASAWTSEALTSPGNILVQANAGQLPSGSATLMWVIDQGRKVMGLDEHGQITETIELPLPRGQIVSGLRRGKSATDDARYVAFQPGGKHLYVFDQQWHLLWTAPPPGNRHEGVREVQWLDIDANGDDEVVALLDGSGLVAWNLAGAQVMTAPLAGGQSVVMSGTPGARVNGLDQPLELLVAGETGRIAAVRAGSEPQAAAPHPPLAIFQLHAGLSADGASPLVGLSYDAQGNRSILGLNSQLEPQWTYNLPGGPHKHPVDWVVSAPLHMDQQPSWVMAAPDGSIHFVSADGRWHDYFYCGRRVSGLALLASGDRQLLVVASGQGVEAWFVEPGTAADELDEEQR